MVPDTGELTVIVCTRNRPEMLRSALASMAPSAESALDVLVVDSASDGPATRGVAREFGVRYVRAERPGLSIARNLGLASTGRPYVIFTDDDCLVTADWATRAVRHFADQRVGAVTGRMLGHTREEPTAPPPAPRRLTRTTQGLDAGHGAVMAFRRETVLRLGGFDEVLGAGRELAGADDLDMFCRLLWAGSHIVNDQSCMVRHAHTRAGEAYLSLYRGYGLGLGALANKWLRIGVVPGVSLAAVMVRRRISGVAKDGLRRGATPARAMFAGMVRGFLDAARLPLQGERFVDVEGGRPAGTSGRPWAS